MYETRPKLSPDGQKWVDRTKIGLQRAINDLVMSNPSLELYDDDFTKAAYATHAPVYIANGFCYLSVADKMNIISTVNIADLMSMGGVAQASIVGWEQIKVYGKDPTFAWKQANDLHSLMEAFKFGLQMKIIAEIGEAVGLLRSTSTPQYTADEVFQVLYGEQIEYFKQTFGDQFVW